MNLTGSAEQWNAARERSTKPKTHKPHPALRAAEKRLFNETNDLAWASRDDQSGPTRVIKSTVGLFGVLPISQDLGGGCHLKSYSS